MGVGLGSDWGGVPFIGVVSVGDEFLVGKGVGWRPILYDPFRGLIRILVGLKIRII